MIKKLLKLSLGFALLVSVFPNSFIGTISANTENLALGKSVTYSGVEGGKKGDGSWTYTKFVGEMAVDGITKDKEKRWSAENIKAGPEIYEQWLQVDLGKEYRIGDIVVDFHAETTDYEIMVSKDGTNYTSVAKVTDGSKGETVVKNINADGETARYVKYVQHKQWKSSNGSFYGSSIYELEVYEYEELEVTDNTLRVGTFNIAAGKTPNVEELRNLTDQYELEVVGLQEVDKNTGRNNYDMLASFATNKYVSSYFSKAIDYSNGEYGVGTVSRYELENCQTTFVDTTGGKEQRVFQRSVLKKGDKEIAFYNTHLSYESLELRAKQFEELKTALENDPMEYKIVVGDFNADQYHYEFYTFLEDMDMVNGYDGVWHDTFNSLGNPEGMKIFSIDNILVTRNLEIKDLKVVPTTLSDHNLFWAELEFLEEPAVSNQWLKAVISEYENIDIASYTDDSKQAFTEALELARSGLTNSTTQVEINKLTTDLVAAYESLETYNLAYKKSVTYSGVEGDKNGDGSWKYPQFVGENTVDGSMTTRWSGNKIDKAWLTVDLGEVKEISEVLIHFESAAPKYQIQVSKNGVDWTTVYEELNGEHGAEGMVQASFEMTEARYVKYQQLERWKHSNNNLYSTSFFEFEIYKEFEINEIQLSSDSDIISKGDSLQLTPTILPTLASHKELNYTSSDNSVATVDSNGLINGVKAGTAIITVESKNNASVTASFTIDVVDGPIKVSKFIFDSNALALTSRDKRFIEYSVYPSKAVDADLEVVWTSSDQNVATITKEGLLETV